jgi:hypothetical protein
MKVLIGERSLKREDLEYGKLVSVGLCLLVQVDASCFYFVGCVQVDASCFYFVGCEWGTHSADEGCDQAQSHADTRGEQRSSWVPELVFDIHSTGL